ncbi:MAG: sigma-70 family RNA polymerase sigma factor [Bacillota bacterium]|nr:sigma-70 family RNA polymerase sigma factor [Bacillota bacterium]
MKITNENVIKQLELKNQKALEYLINTYSNNVYILIFRIIGAMASKEDIEECVSEVFVDIWNNSTRYDKGRGSIKTWILITAKYTALDFRRKYTSKTTADSIYNEDILSKESVEESVISKETAREILEALNELPETDKQIFYRRFYLYEDIESIAESMGLTRQAVDNRLWRGRKILKEKLQIGREETI